MRLLIEQIVFAAAVTIALAAPAFGADALGRRPVFVVKPEAVVRGETVYLKDIAVFTDGESGFSDLVGALKGLKVADAPAPRMQETVPGMKIFEAIEAAGLPKDSFGYSIPKSVSITREGRVVERSEVLNAIRQRLFNEKTLDLQPRDVSWSAEQVIPDGKAEVKVDFLGEPSAGKLPVRVDVIVEGQPAARFMATAVVDDWREIPVVKRSLDRGMLISPGDIEIVRMNLSKEPADVLAQAGEVVGRRVKGRLDAGDAIRRSEVDIPPVIQKGKKVALVFRLGGLEASASGVAMEDGFSDGSIKVRNDSSKKIVTGKVVSADEVEVDAR